MTYSLKIYLLFAVLLTFTSCYESGLEDIDYQFENAEEETIKTDCKNIVAKIPPCFDENIKYGVSLTNNSEWYCSNLKMYITFDMINPEFYKEELTEKPTIDKVLDYYSGVRKANMHSFSRAKNIEEIERNGNNTITAYLKGKVQAWSDEALIYLHIIEKENCYYCVQYIFPADFATYYDTAIKLNIESIKF